MPDQDTVNDTVRKFVNQLDVVEWIWIDIDIRGQVERLFDVQFTGRGDLLTHPSVSEYLDGGGFINGFRFRVRFQGELFEAKIAYNRRMAYVSVWRGGNSISLARQLLESLTTLYLRMFNPTIGQ